MRTQVLCIALIPALTFAEYSGPKPGPATTGPTTPGSLVAYAGPNTITTPNTTVEGVAITGTITIEADSVTLRNFVLDADSGWYGVNVVSGTGTLIEDGEIFTVRSSGLLGSNITARRLNIHESGGDGMKIASNSLIEGCWVHHIGTNPDAHADCQQMVAGSNSTFRGNFMDIPINSKGGPGEPYKSNSTFIIQTNNGPIDNILIEDNWLNGGNYTIYIRDKGTGYGPPTNVRVLNNRFGRDYQYGVLSVDGAPIVAGNVWDDSGELMAINNTDAGVRRSHQFAARAASGSVAGVVLTLSGRSMLRPGSGAVPVSGAGCLLIHGPGPSAPHARAALLVR